MARIDDERTYSGQARELSVARLLAFSGGPLATPGWPARNLHTDAAKAAEGGLTAPIASGVQCESDLIRLLIELFGDAWFAHGKMHVKYPRPVFAGAFVRACARVRARTALATGARVELDVWCETGDKTVVISGTASCIEAAAA